MRPFSLYIVLATAVVLSSCHSPQNNGYTLVWEDDFSGEVLDTIFWNVEDNCRGGGNAEMQYYTPRNISIERHPLTGESCLVLTAKREDYRNRPATSARLNTHGKVEFQYGKIEARIAFPHTADGLWPAFWMLGADLARNLGNNDAIDAQKSTLAHQGRVVWPACGEIDIVEMGHKNGIDSGTQDRYFNGATHWGEDYNRHQYFFHAQNYTADYAVQGDFHLFTVLWTEDSIAMYLDQDKYPEVQPYYTLSLRNKAVNEPGHYFNKPFYILFNLAVGGNFPALPTIEKYPEVVTMDDPNFQQVTALPADGTPVKMYVDYVRVYKQ